MKKLLLIIACLLLLVGCGKEESSYKITLDINPSLEMEVENEKVKEITALNDEAKELVNKRMKGRLVESAFEDLIKKAKEKDLLDNDTLNVILGTENPEDGIAAILKSAAKENKVRINVIVPDINEEARTLASKYKITAAKAAFIQGIVKANDKVKFEDMIDKSIRELIEMKNTSLYCDDGYSLRNGNCEKAIKVEEPTKGSICPEGYQKVKDTCYMIGIIKHEPTCKEGYELKEGKCIGTERVPASATCSGSSYNSSTGLCESFVYVSDVVINDDDEETCPSGGSISIGNKGKGCYQTVTSAPKYSCKKGKLEGNECVIESGSKEPTLEVVCDKGLTKYKDVACLDYRKKSDYITGYTCKSGARLEKDKCVYYKVVAAKQK